MLAAAVLPPCSSGCGHTYSQFTKGLIKTPLERLCDVSQTLQAVTLRLQNLNVLDGNVFLAGSFPPSPRRLSGGAEEKKGSSEDGIRTASLSFRRQPPVSLSIHGRVSLLTLNEVAEILGTGASFTGVYPPCVYVRWAKYWKHECGPTQENKYKMLK